MTGATVYRVTIRTPKYHDPAYRYFHGAEAEGDATRWVRDLTGPPGTRWQLHRLGNGQGDLIDQGRITE